MPPRLHARFTRPRALLLAAAISLGAFEGCTCQGPEPGPLDAGPTAPLASAPASASASIAAPTPAVPPPEARQGSAVALGVGEEALYLADEDHGVLRRVPLPLKEGEIGTAISLPGAPAQVVTLPGRVLVTVRDPGLLVVLTVAPGQAPVESARVPLPADAWGLAVTADASLALVSSAWTHKLSAVDLQRNSVRWTVDVGREPRGLALQRDGRRAYLSHLTGAALTRVDDLGGSSPTVQRLELAASPLRAPAGKALNASLGYALTLSPDEGLLFAPRHALGALGDEAWFGAATVDVLDTLSGKGLAPPHREQLPLLRAQGEGPAPELMLPGTSLTPFTQPRAIVYRRRSDTLLVVGQGDDRLVELDALAVDPTLAVLATHELGRDRDPALGIAARCAAPEGLALSADEATAFVFCRATGDLASIALSPHAPRGALTAAVPQPPTIVHLADDTLSADAAIGRRLFYNATDRLMSGGVGCAGCHPEGRDDGQVWHEARFNTKDGTNLNFVGVSEQLPEADRVRGVPRRTPMLAGRVRAAGPYGWVGESPDLPARMRGGFGLHRWGGLPKHVPQNLDARALRLALFLRSGLVPPPRAARELDATELRGKALFNSEALRCARCHVPATDYSDRTVYPLAKLARLPDFDEEKSGELRVPSLLYLDGRAPYLHDGSAASLDDLLTKNNDRMGKTNQLSKEERDALAAFLRTL